MIRTGCLSRGIFRGQNPTRSTARALFSTTFVRSNNAADIEKVKRLIEEKMVELKAAEAKRKLDEAVSCYKCPFYPVKP